MVTTDSKERARLLTLGNYALNHLQKLLSSLAPAEGAVTMTKEERAWIEIDVRRLLVVGSILGKDGQIFTERGEKVAAYPGFHYDPSGFRKSVATQIHCYLGCIQPDVDPALLHAQIHDCWTEVHKDDENEATSPLEKALAVADEEEFMTLLGLPVEAAKVKHCAYCGAKARQDQVLLACGRCRAALYCDKWCQRQDWKEHKLSCTGKGSESKEVSGEQDK